ncbi:MAG: transposase [Janthinobacterium lividum]
MERGQVVSRGSVWRVLHEQGWRRKKSLHATERDTPRVYALCSAHVEAIAHRPDVARFHFLDETGLPLDYTRRYGRAPGGQPIPLKRGRSLTLIGALSVRGPHGAQVLKGALTHRSFALYISRILGPRLRRGDVLVLNNLRVHHLTGLRQWLAHAGSRFYFCPLTPRFYARQTGLEQAQSGLAPPAGPYPACAGRSLPNSPDLDYAHGCSTLVLLLRLPRTPFVNLLYSLKLLANQLL